MMSKFDSAALNSLRRSCFLASKLLGGASVYLDNLQNYFFASVSKIFACSIAVRAFNY
jgi:hypothetical protein